LQPVEAEPMQAEAAAEPVEVAGQVAEQVEEAVTETVEQGANTMTETIEKAREATQQTAAQFQNAMGETSQQAKAAMEKGARVAEELADLTRGNIEALVASSKTAAKYVETLSQGAADYSRRSFEEASTALRSFAEVKSPTDFFRLQSDFARSQFDSMVAESARVSETMVKMSGDVAEPITSRYSVAAERLKTLAA
jgi:phasin family protein